MDWRVVGYIAGIILPAVAGGIVTWLFEGRPRLLSFVLGSSAVTLKPQLGQQGALQPLTVHSHTLVIRNRGRKAAQNVRIGHHNLPAFSIEPSLHYRVDTLPSGEMQIVFPVLPPRTQASVNYVYFPPLLWNQTHTAITSDDGPASARNMQIMPRPPNALIVLCWALMALGLATVVYFLYLAIAQLV
jgi:hypothetical protein